MHHCRTLKSSGKFWLQLVISTQRGWFRQFLAHISLLASLPILSFSWCVLSRGPVGDDAVVDVVASGGRKLEVESRDATKIHSGTEGPEGEENSAVRRGTYTWRQKKGTVLARSKNPRPKLESRPAGAFLETTFEHDGSASSAEVQLEPQTAAPSTDGDKLSPKSEMSDDASEEKKRKHRDGSDNNTT